MNGYYGNVWQARMIGSAHVLTFQLSESAGKTLVRFEHAGWKNANDFFAGCTFTWGRYMESLRQYCQTGKGEAFGSEGYRQ